MGIGPSIVQLFGWPRRLKTGLKRLRQLSLLVPSFHVNERWRSNCICWRGIRQIVVIIANIFEPHVANGPNMILEVVPVLFRKRIFPRNALGLFQLPHKAHTIDARRDSNLCQLQHRRCDVDTADQRRTNSSRLDHLWKTNQKRCSNTTVVKRRLVTRKRTTIIAEEQDERVICHALLLQFIDDVSHKPIETSDFGVVIQIVLAHILVIGMVGR